MRATGRERQPVRVALALVVRNGRVLVQRRPRGRHLGGLWEFPGGKVRTGEAPPAAARRELAEETGLSGGSLTRLGVYRHDYPDRRVELRAYLLRGTRGQPVEDSARWLTWRQIRDLPMPPANGAMVRDLGQALRRPGAGCP